MVLWMQQWYTMKYLASMLVDEFEFELNSYDAYVANKVIDGKVCTILWWVDNTKLSHEDADVVTRILY